MLIALDTETGGLDATKNPILSFALYAPGITPFYAQVWGDPNLCDVKALQINGLDPTAGRQLADIILEFNNWHAEIGAPKFEVIGHNVGPFDMPFIKQLNLPCKFDYHYRDTLVAAALLKDSGKIQLEKLNLKACCEYFGITYDAHNALEDARASYELWHKCLGIIKS